MAVYTKISENDLEILLSGYKIGALKNFTAITAGIQNTNYFLDTENARYVLTIYETRVNKDDLPFFLNLTEHLAKRGVPCPLPIANNDGEKISTIQGKPCAIISFVKGTEVENITINNVQELGKNLALMHLASQDFSMQRSNEMGIKFWPQMFKNVESRANEIAPDITPQITNAIAFLNNNWPKNLPSGIIHGDIFPDNVLFADNGSIAGIIDFYFACNDIFMYDLAICLNSWCFDDNKTYNPDKSNALISSYNNVKKLATEELEALPILSTGAALRFLLTRMYSALNRVDGALVTTKDPLEYLNKLKFHSSIKSYEEYGIKLKIAA